MKSDVIILAGGLGTRLAHIIKNVPKPMAQINSNPFLAYIFTYLEKFNTKKVILSVGHLHEQIINYFSCHYKNIELVYAIEKTPLGTGGAINDALKYVQTENAFILNGDTFFNVNLNNMEDFHLNHGHEITISLKELSNFKRYGSVEIAKNRILSFKEKAPIKRGYINAGTYLLNKKAFQCLEWPEKFSFEKEFLEKKNTTFHFSPFISDEYFIDIGVPEDYNKAINDFKTLFPE